MQLHCKPLPKGKNKKVIGLMEDELGRKIKTKVVGLKVKTYTYLKDDGNENKNEKKAQKSVSYKEISNLKIIKTV